jgi:hypothetical protein
MSHRHLASTQLYLFFGDIVLLSVPGLALNSDPSAFTSKVTGIIGFHHHFRQVFL